MKIQHVEKNKSNEVEQIDETFFARPPVDIFENEKEVIILAELPGVVQDSLNIQLNGKELLLEGKVQQLDKGKLLFGEFHEGGFRRVFKLQQRINAEQVNANLENGLLRIQLPKAPELKMRSIPITTYEANPN